MVGDWWLVAASWWLVPGVWCRVVGSWWFVAGLLAADYLTTVVFWVGTFFIRATAGLLFLETHTNNQFANEPEGLRHF